MSLDTTPLAQRARCREYAPLLAQVRGKDPAPWASAMTGAWSPLLRCGRARCGPRPIGPLMAHVYRQFYEVLHPGGYLVLVVKGRIRQGRYVDVPARPAALLEAVGFVVQHWHQAMLTAREAQLTLEGREERHRHLSLFRRVYARRNAGVCIDHEVVLCAEKPRAVSSRT